jgi:hypothetical protein
MKPLLQTPLFRIGTAAMATAAAGVMALFIYALNAPTQPELLASTSWTTTVSAAGASAPLVPIQVNAAIGAR